ACVVVDDASADAEATKEIAERHGARFVGLATNAGPSIARNAGLAAAASALSRYETVRSSLDRGPQEGLVRPGGPIPFVPSAALLVRSAVVTGPDLFDPGLRGGEDVDLVWR